MRRRRHLACFAACVGALASTACGNEARSVEAGLPLTPPTGAADPRIEQTQQNAYQVSQGGRYYTWYGCGGCHASSTGSGPDLGLGHWRHGDGFDAVYASIAHHGPVGDPAAAGAGIPVEQLWQITAYVRALPALDPQKRRRQDLDLIAEPAGRQAPVPLR